MKKYQFIFDSDKKTIGFYAKKNEKYNLNHSSKLKIKYFIYFMATIIFSILIGICIAKRIYKKKKNIVSEMSEDLEYKSAENNNNKVNQQIEMENRLFINK